MVLRSKQTGMATADLLPLACPRLPTQPALFPLPPAGRTLLQRSGRSPDDISSIVLVERGASYIQSDAILRIASGLGAPLPLVAAALGALPRPVRDTFYDCVADNRYNLFGRTASCRLSDPRFEERFVS